MKKDLILGIEGHFLIDVSSEEFEKRLMEWLDKNGWGFIGVTGELKEDGQTTH